MKVMGGRTENGVVVGNTYDKYGSRNPVVRYLMRGFTRALDECVALAAPESVYEVGCGEGYWSMRWMEQGLAVSGSDFSAQAVAEAKAEAARRGLPPEAFSVGDVYALPEGLCADLVVCCEVMEHLEDPERALDRLGRIAERHLLLSVPREPVWSLMNLARGKYLGSLGNTPGHIQRWSTNSFVAMVSRRFSVLEVRTPLPWTMVLCSK